MSNTLTIAQTLIRELNGLYSLNDLHKAAGGEAKHQPALFLRLEQTQALIAEIESSADSRSLKETSSTDVQSLKETSSTDVQSLAVKTILGKGKQQGTYACKELVIAYAAWISAAFHLKVIRVFLDAVQPAQRLPYHVAKDQTLSAEQADVLRQMMEDFAASLPQQQRGVFMRKGWSKLKSHFKTDYRHIPAENFNEAVSIVSRHIAVSHQSETGRALNVTDAVALDEARQAAHAYMEAFRANPTQTKFPDLPVQVLEGVIADALQGARFVVSFDYGSGKPCARMLPSEAAIVDFHTVNPYDLASFVPVPRIPQLVGELVQRMGLMLTAHIARTPA